MKFAIINFCEAVANSTTGQIKFRINLNKKKKPTPNCWGRDFGAEGEAGHPGESIRRGTPFLQCVLQEIRGDDGPVIAQIGQAIIAVGRMLSGDRSERGLVSRQIDDGPEIHASLVQAKSP